MSSRDPNWVRDNFGVDMTRFNWSTAAPLATGPASGTSYVTIPGTLIGQNNDWNPVVNTAPFGSVQVIRFTSAVGASITGMVANVGGEIKTIVNIGVNALTISN